VNRGGNYLLGMPACRCDGDQSKQAVTQRRDGLLRQLGYCLLSKNGLRLVAYPKNYVRQCYKRDADKQKHNDPEHHVPIFHRNVFSLIRFGGSGRTGQYLMLQRFEVSFVLNQIVHLPVPSENVSRRGKEF
jgi:hypothetical protein